MLRVLRMHRDASAVAGSTKRSCLPSCSRAAQESWDAAVARRRGVRRAQLAGQCPGADRLPRRRLARRRPTGASCGCARSAIPTARSGRTPRFDVLTDDGARAATKFYVNGLEQVVDVRPSAATGSTGTTKHRIKVVDEAGEWVWRRFADLRPGDRVPLALGQLIGEPQRGRAAAAVGEDGVGGRASRRRARGDDAGAGRARRLLHGRRLAARRGLAALRHRRRPRRRRAPRAAGQGAVRHPGRTSTPQQGYVERRAALGAARRVVAGVRLRQAPPARGPRRQGLRRPHPRRGARTPTIRRCTARSCGACSRPTARSRSGYPSWTTANVAFADDVQTLLLALGFVTTAGRSESAGAARSCRSCACSTGPRTPRWLDEIGFISARKAQASTSATSPRVGRYDHIPVTRALIDRVAPDNDRDRKVALMEFRRSGTITRRLATELLRA